MKHHTITGGGGTQLHLAETGNARGRPILFLHGFSQCWLSWSRQLNSNLADDYRLLAMDLRGHGQSDKPRDAYGDSTLWAADVAAVIDRLELEQPVLCGWSYGSLVILDYVRHHGEGAIGGMIFVSGITKLGSDEAIAVLTPEFLTLVPGLFAADVEESARSLSALLRMCLAEEPSAAELYPMLGYNLSVPPHVRQAMFSRAFDNDDLLPKIQKPVLIVHGARDAIVKPTVVEQHRAGLARARVEMMPDVGHAPFWEDAGVFNRHVRTFCERLEVERVS
jgi:pimeloyl-ACP methyl ester carboxylesterase